MTSEERATADTVKRRRGWRYVAIGVLFVLAALILAGLFTNPYMLVERRVRKADITGIRVQALDFPSRDFRETTIVDAQEIERWREALLRGRPDRVSWFGSLPQCACKALYIITILDDGAPLCTFDITAHSQEDGQLNTESPGLLGGMIAVHDPDLIALAMQTGAALQVFQGPASRPQ